MSSSLLVQQQVTGGSHPSPNPTNPEVPAQLNPTLSLPLLSSSDALVLKPRLHHCMLQRTPSRTLDNCLTCQACVPTTKHLGLDLRCFFWSFHSFGEAQGTWQTLNTHIWSSGIYSSYHPA